MTQTVRELITEAGFGPTTTYQTWNTLVSLADLVAATIQLPTVRAMFVAEAAVWLIANRPPLPFSENDLLSDMDTAESARSSPFGSTEIWGSVLQRIDCEGPEGFDGSPYGA